MKIYKALFWIALIVGITIFSIGAYLKFTNQASNGLTAGRFGDIHHERITGFSGMFLGVMFIVLSIWTYRMYKEEKEKFDKMD
ncbi:hypothetical protein [Pontibacter ramchanderi]|uniref:Uncharacterized protein n=1 Tax=Pontibacter ramchanderi TaxID=1179743 RepID=A0A2N3V2T5_9BACT|nr:hypothetical protein [Pontibacter ramchanderi]PKV75945.1 hypothetical protein BD749_0893 [Pontibacter ramchanderi]